VLPEDPATLITGKNYGSEGTAQRYLCALMINGSNYGYHKSWPLTERGVRFVAELYARAFDSAPTGAPQFWNELNLLAVEASDKQAVDYGFLWPEVHFLVELKTLGGSHRRGQLAEYLRRARHHSPDQAIDLLYLTQPMTAATPDLTPEGCRYAHLSWPDALEAAESVWAASDDPRVVRCLTLLRGHLEAEGALAGVTTRRKAVGNRPTTSADALPEQWLRVVDGAVMTAAKTAAGGRHAVDVPLDLVADEDFQTRLMQVRQILEARIASAPELAGVTVWQWTSTSSGLAYTEAGSRTGLELRLTPPRPHRGR
jgi:hypothetical protein